MPRESCVEVYRGRKKKWHWRITSSNGRIVGASSEGYSRIQFCESNFTDLTDILLVYNKDNIDGETVVDPPRGIHHWKGHVVLSRARSDGVTLFGVKR